ncbi:MAG: hypothetical protein WCT03_09050 [Candidatus Obscuribacterales bacterium]
MVFGSYALNIPLVEDFCPATNKLVTEFMSKCNLNHAQRESLFADFAKGAKGEFAVTSGLTERAVDQRKSVLIDWLCSTFGEKDKDTISQEKQLFDRLYKDLFVRFSTDGWDIQFHIGSSRGQNADDDTISVSCPIILAQSFLFHARKRAVCRSNAEIIKAWAVPKYLQIFLPKGYCDDLKASQQTIYRLRILNNVSNRVFVASCSDKTLGEKFINDVLIETGLSAMTNMNRLDIGYRNFLTGLEGPLWNLTLTVHDQSTKPLENALEFAVANLQQLEKLGIIRRNTC